MSRNTSIATRSGDDQAAVMAAQLDTQYKKAIGGLMEVVKFGAMMLALRDSLSNQGSGNAKNFDAKGEGLKGWLAEHCPEINTSTAWRFMLIADGVKQEMEIGRKVDFAALLNSEVEDLEPKLAKKRREIEAFLAGKSQRQLLFSFAKPDPARRGGAREIGPDERTPEQKLADEMAGIRKVHEDLVKNMGWYAAEGEGWRRLERVEIEAFLGTLEAAADAVRNHLANLMPTRRA